MQVSFPFCETRPFAAEGVQCSGVREETAARNGDSPKDLGVYYTDSQVADFLIWWAARDPEDTVLDPSFGGGVFLRSACKRLREMGGDLTSQVFGIELDAGVHTRIAEKLRDEFGVDQANLLCSDFFEVGSDRLFPVDVVVGNPPFIPTSRVSTQYG